MTSGSAAFVLYNAFYVCFFASYTSSFSTRNRAHDAVAPAGQRHQWQPGVEIELPNFEALFDRIQTASPLAKLIMEGDSLQKEGGFQAIDGSTDLKWKRVEANAQKTVHRIDKLDSFQNIKTPLLRFRSTIKGPCLGERFSNFIMDLEERKKWDDQVAHVEEMYPINDLDAVNDVLGHKKFGMCTRIGVGYTQTKQGIISPREQLIMGGMQEYDNGATILWGTEMEEYHNHLLPPGPRHTRAKSHLFAATLAPTGEDSFDVEYLLQMDVGGGIPNFMTTPALTDAVKKLFEHAKGYFEGGEGSELDLYLKSKQEEMKFAEVDFLEVRHQELLDGLDHSDDHGNAMNERSILFTP
ncbi:hypothetical protein ACHAXS_011673 [Conticribra weissflogii]